ncbi:DNRLRE domain-containing protein [Clostridium sp. Marseille-Q7071]
MKILLVSEKQKSLSFGEYPYIRVGDKEGFRYRSFIKFDISKMPLNCHITRASLNLYSQDKKAFEVLGN